MRTLPPPPPAKKLYSDLGVREDATPEQIRAAWIRLVRHHHPDVQGGEVSAAYLAATHAFDVLSDPAQRTQYDETGIDPGEALRGLQAAAMELITAAAFRSVVEDDIGRGNLLEQIRASLRRDHTQATAESRRIDCAIERTTNVRSNIERRWKGAEVARTAILAMIDANMSKDVQHKAACDQKLKLITLAIQMLDGATYDMPKDDKWAVLYSPYAQSWKSQF